MSNKEAYLDDLAELNELIDKLLRTVPEGKTVKDKENRAHAEQIASSAQALISCMETGYIPIE